MRGVKMSDENQNNEKKGLTMKKKDLWKIGTVVFALLFIVSATALLMGRNGATGEVVNDIEKEIEKTNGEVTGKVTLDFYVMSQCPYGTQVMDAIEPVLEKLGDAVDFEANYISTDLGNGEFQSLHGEPETKGNIVQLCAAKYNPDKYMKMIICQNQDARAIPDNWQSCATQNGLDLEKIRTCYEGEEGKQLLSQSVKKAEAAQARGSPTIYLNGEPYQGGRGENDFLRAICNAFESDKPQACADIPPAKKVMTVVLNDERCKECDVSGVIASLKAIFPGLETIEIVYSSEQGKKLYDEANITYLPAILFDESVKEGEGYANVKPYLLPAGKYTSLRIGAQFDPTKEICDNEIDDTGDGKIDCDDLDCKEALECREEKKSNLQVFIMSDCPYGKKAVEALKEVVDNFGSALDYEVHYIANEAEDGFNSLHGQYEVDENIIQLCVKEHSPEKWLDYIYCRSTKGVKDIDWNECAEETKVDVDAVQTCFDGDEGSGLLREDIKIANSLQIGASPTWLANNRYQFGGIDAETIKKEFCKYNEDAKGCENTLSSDTGGVPSGSC